MRSKLFLWLMSLCLIAASSGFVCRDAAGAEPVSADHAYTDPRTGAAFFDVYLGGGHFVVLRTADGEWRRLPDAVQQIWGESEAGCVRINPYWLQPQPFLDACYDAEADELVYTAMFEPSPSGKWGLKTILFHETSAELRQSSEPHPPVPYGSFIHGKKGALMLKNYATGEIRLIGVTGILPDYEWLPDGTLALVRYNEAERVHELARVHPATGETKRLFSGLLRNYNEELGLLLYVHKDEWFIYDYRTGKSRPYRAEEDGRLFARPVPPAREVPPPSPEAFDYAALPVAGTELREKSAAVLTLDSAEVRLPFAFVGLDGETYVPLRPLVDRGWTWRRETLAGGGHEFVVETERGELRLNRANSMALNDRLYLSIDLIQSLGHDVEWRWLR